MPASRRKFIAAALLKIAKAVLAAPKAGGGKKPAVSQEFITYQQHVCKACNKAAAQIKQLIAWCGQHNNAVTDPLSRPVELNGILASLERLSKEVGDIEPK